jgi:predicted transporter
VERRVGTVRTLGVFVLGHVGATVLTVCGLAVGVGMGWLPASLTHATDVGPSYGLAALAGVLAARVVRRDRRRLAVGALLLALVVASVVGGDFTDVGHLIAALLGVGAVAAGALSRPEA